MPMFPEKLNKKLRNRIQEDAFRELPVKQELVDFASNDYLGFSGVPAILRLTEECIQRGPVKQNGSTGSRLLTGNHALYNTLETFLSSYHESESALVFNSGYDANVGFFSSVPQRGDIVLYDELVHASIRDGISMGNAKSYNFSHNDLDALKVKTKKVLRTQPKHNAPEVYVVTESVFSMDGDSPKLKGFADFCTQNGFHLIVDEAHATGVFGKGCVQQMEMADAIFARIITFGKALGTHGAAVLGNKTLRDYLVNFARSFIYTTAMSPHAVATILGSYQFLDKKGAQLQEELHGNISLFRKQVRALGLQDHFIASHSAIHCIRVPGNEKVKALSRKLNEKGFSVKPILSPTVKKGEERLRFCLHSYNTKKEITQVLELVKAFIIP